MTTRPPARHARPKSYPWVLPFLASAAVVAAMVISALPRQHLAAGMSSDALTVQAPVLASHASASPSPLPVSAAPVTDPHPVFHVPPVASASPVRAKAASTANPSVPVPTATRSATPVASPNPSAPPTGTDIGARLLAVAESRTGDSYSWGGTGPTSFDCSGLVYWAAGQLGIANWPRDTYDLLGTGVSEGLLVPTSNPQPGDLAFFGTGHVEFLYDLAKDEVFGAEDWGVPVGVQTWYPGSWQPTAYYRIT